MFKVNGFKPKQFLNVLCLRVKEIINKNKWNADEKIMVDNTFDRLNKISKLHFYDSQYNNDNKTDFHNKNETNSKKEYYNRKPYNNNRNTESWRKQKVDDLSENVSNNSRQHQFALNHINQNKHLEKYSDLTTEPSTSEHKVIYNNLPVKKSIEPMNSDSMETKLKKFENKFSSLGNLHVVSIEKNSINKPFSSRTHGRGTNRYGGYKPSWRNQQDDSQNQDSYEIFHSHGIDSQHSQEYKNEYPKNQQDRNPRHKFGNRPLSSGSYKKDIDDTES